ncbi:pericentriolar material 1 protein-like isoform X1 [Macrosteles quadrilineatus]|uniref:pericentriolar material 1 protein-like isoform X1 n=1 Tax=Macrosteles quadrilineatus TaxID=74068 RepID=UPI0023E26880|nr:pericentriolar material 1 protein-like isoform X1 [Macrosteles quadrilineatus]
MAPGIGGNGGGPRQTGTVPKTKSHNEASREYNGATRRDYHPFNHVHMPNNLSSLDWQPVNETIPHPRNRKESNTSASRFSESFDTEENGVTQDNLWFNTGQRHSVYNSDDDEVSQASWAENGYKSNNLGQSDKAQQVASRLHQIRDYVNQTVSMMDGLRATGGQRNMAQHEKLSSMLEGLRDSELKLQSLYERLQRNPAQPKGEPDNFPAQQMLDTSRERANTSVTSSSKSSEAARKNELKKQVHISQLKLQELQEQQAALKALKQKAQEQLNEARAAQGALMAAHGTSQAAANTDNMIQERLQNLQRFFDARHQIVQIAGLEDEEADTSEVQNKLDELQAKKHNMDQLLAQFSNLHTNVANNVADELSPDECERDVQNKMAELNAMREFLSTLQNSAPQLRPASPQERVVKKDSRGGSVEKSNTPTNQTLHVKTQQLNEAKARLQQLQNLLHTVEELRSNGQPIPESVLRLMNGSEHSSSPTQQDRSDMSSQDLNVSQGPSDRLVNSSERAEMFERSCRSLNSCERERVKQQPANTVKHNNQEGKVGMKIQLEELIRNQDLSLPQPLQSSSFQEPGNGTTIGTWGGSTQSTLDEGYNPDYSGDMTETTSVKNAPSCRQPHNMWRKPSSGSASRYSWSTPYVPQEVRRGGERGDNVPTADIPPQPDTHWVVQQISQLQSQLQQMSGLYKNFVEKQQNSPPPWLTPPISAALGPYCQYIASAGQWQQQQLLVHSLNQCCQLIWHQQHELAALKETLAQLHHQNPEAAQFSPQQVEISSPPSNLGRAHNQNHNHNHGAVKPSLAPPAVVSSAHSLPNLVSPQSPPSPPPVNNRNLLASPTATVLSLPPSLNTNPANPNIYFNPHTQFTDPNFINLYPPYGNNLNFEFPSPVNFFPNPPEQFLPFHPQPQPATTLNNQVPPGNRANNYWDNFRSYSRQNLLSNSGKSNDGLQQQQQQQQQQQPQQQQQQSQRTPMERFLNTDHEGLPPPPRSRKERLVRGEVNQLMTRAQVHQEEGEGEASGHQYNLSLPSHGRQVLYSPHNNTYSESEGMRLVNDCEAPRGANKHKRNYIDIPAREAKISQLNNYHTEPSESNTEADSSRAINLPRRHPRNINSISDNSSNNSNNLHQQQNCIGDGYCLMASDKGVRRKDNRGNLSKDCKTDASGSGDTLEECVYSEVAALISVNEWRPQYLLQLFKDLRLLSSCPDPGMQATLSSTIHALASRSSQEERRAGVGVVSEESVSTQTVAAPDYLASFSHQPQTRNWTQKETIPPPPPPPPPQLPSNCAKLDREVRSVLTEMLPFIMSQAGETCGPALLESVRKLILHLVHTPPPATQDQLDAQLEDALHKFIGHRLGDVYEELLINVADVLISELTFLRLVNTVHHNHSTEQPNGDVVQVVEEEEEEEEGAVGGVVGESVSSSLLNLHPANQARRNKFVGQSEPVSEADLAEADQSRHSTGSGGEEERGDTAEGIDQLEEASGRDVNMATCNGNLATESKTEACWAVEQDRELGLDQVPTRLHNCETEPDASHPGPPDPNTSI